MTSSKPSVKYIHLVVKDNFNLCERCLEEGTPYRIIDDKYYIENNGEINLSYPISAKEIAEDSKIPEGIVISWIWPEIAFRNRSDAENYMKIYGYGDMYRIIAVEIV